MKTLVPRVERKDHGTLTTTNRYRVMFEGDPVTCICETDEQEVAGDFYELAVACIKMNPKITVRGLQETIDVLIGYGRFETIIACLNGEVSELRKKLVYDDQGKLVTQAAFNHLLAQRDRQMAAVEAMKRDQHRQQCEEHNAMEKHPKA